MNILFLFAHMDDEAFGPAGTIAKLAKTNNVTVVSLCKGDRPGSETVMTPRREAFIKSCELLGVSYMLFSSSDLRLEYHTAMQDATSVMNIVNPDVVYTHNSSDLHKDHRLVAEIALALCRPTPGSRITELYMCELPNSTPWAFDQLGPTFVPNTYVDVTEYIDIKEEVLSYYNTELRDYPDARSVKAMTELAAYRGTHVGTQYAEAFKQVYRLC